MFSIHSINISDFKSYKGDHAFIVPEDAGLYFITGSNDVEARLGSNGAGKSTLLDAVFWCLYGKTLRGLKSGDVISWGERSCTVSVELTVGSSTFTVTRQQTPNKLTLAEGKKIRPVDQAALQNYLRLTPESFAASVMAPQFGQSFFELTPALKLTLFSQIMNLDNWLELSQKAADSAREIDILINASKSKIAVLESKIEEATFDIERLTSEKSDFEKSKATAVAKIEAELSSLEGTRQKTEKTVAFYAAEKEKLGKQLKGFQAEEANLSAKLSQIRNKREQCRSNLAVAQSRVEQDEKKLRQIDKLGAFCQTCLQKVDQRHVKAETIRLEQAARDGLSEAKVLKATLDKVLADEKVLSAKIDTLTAEWSRIRKQETEAALELGLVNSTLLRVQDDRQRLKDSLNKEKTRANPYSALLDNAFNTVKQAKAKLKEEKSTAEANEAAYAATSFWVAGFKRLRLFIIDETLRSLEIEVNNSLASLGLPDWQIEFDIERENKSGGVTKGFTVLISSPAHPEPVKWESWSGGETQRLQLAGMLGLSNLIMTQAGLRNTIEFFDEPTKHLSGGGVSDLAEALHQRAVNDGKRIFLIDHRTVSFDGFAGVIKVVKTENGSEIVQE